MRRVIWFAIAGLIWNSYSAPPGVAASDPRMSVQEPAVPPGAAEAEGKADERPNADDDESSKTSASTSPSRARPTFDKQSDEILESLRPITVDANRVTVRITTQGRPVALGVIVDSGGYVLTKASELRGNLMCRLTDGRSLSAEVFGVHEKTDLALLKINATELPTADWNRGDAPAVGYWVVTPKQDDSPALGIVSVKPRTILPPTGYMGVELKPNASGVRIDKIFSKSPAEIAGLQINDVIVEVNGKPVTDTAMLIETIHQHSVGAEVTLKIMRGGQPMDFRIQLTDHSVLGPGADRNEVQNEMGGRLSKRRLDFPMALQHDTPLSPSECGGPIIDLTGKIVGVNIARSGRVDSLALPTATVLSVIDALKSGELAPRVIHKTEIEKIQARLAEISAEMEQLPQRQSELADKLTNDTARLEELNRVMEDVQSRLNQLKDQQGQTNGQLNAANASSSKLQKEKERLEHELQKLMSGTN